MIVVELRTLQGAPEGGPVPVVATVRVDAAGQISVEGPRPEVVDLEMHALAPGRRRVFAAEDPHEWARLLPRTYRSPYLHAVVVQDDDHSA